MELIGSLLLIGALVVVVALFVGQPFLRRTPVVSSRVSNARQKEDHERSSLLAERDRVLTSLQELDFDYALGKVPEEEYPQQRALLLKTGTEVLRRLDTLHPGSGLAGAVGSSMEDRIEAAVASRRADSRGGMAVQAQVATGSNGKPSAVRAADPLEDVIANRKRERKESSAGFCPRCGRPVQKSDKFCSRCGADL